MKKKVYELVRQKKKKKKKKINGNRTSEGRKSEKININEEPNVKQLR